MKGKRTECANLEKLYDLIEDREASVICNGQKVLAFDDPEWRNIVSRDTIEELEDFIIQNSNAPDENPVITYRTEVTSMGVGESWSGKYRVEELSYFRDLLKKYKTLIEEQKEEYEKDGSINTSKRSDTGKTWGEFVKAFKLKPYILGEALQAWTGGLDAWFPPEPKDEKS